MAGMPQELLRRAEEILHQLEEERGGPGADSMARNIAPPKVQLSIFDAHSETFAEIRRMLEGIDINRLTPVEALMKLNEVKNRIG
jgi:DNA mismatch repair protein MutS